jgi:hypothetical protein
MWVAVSYQRDEQNQHIVWFYALVALDAQFDRAAVDGRRGQQQHHSNEGRCLERQGEMQPPLPGRCFIVIRCRYYPRPSQQSQQQSLAKIWHRDSDGPYHEEGDDAKDHEKEYTVAIQVVLLPAIVAAHPGALQCVTQSVHFESHDEGRTIRNHHQPVVLG